MDGTIIVPAVFSSIRIVARESCCLIRNTMEAGFERLRACSALQPLHKDESTF
jgi:hypothetical protein